MRTGSTCLPEVAMTTHFPAAASYPNNCVTEKQGLLNSLCIDYLLLGSIQSANEILPSMEDQWDQGCIDCKGSMLLQALATTAIAALFDMQSSPEVYQRSAECTSNGGSLWHPR